MYCLSSTAQKRKDIKLWDKREQRNTEEILYLDVRWVVLFGTAEQKIPLSRIRSCHRMLNTIYGGSNHAELDKVPDQLPYPFRSVIGKMNIQFLPLDETKVTVEYIAIDSYSLKCDNPLKDAQERAGVLPHILNFYVGNCNKGTLGQADPESNCVFGLYSATGGYYAPGTLFPYHLGKTWAHNVGHALSLHHIFSDDACDGTSLYPDIPEAIRPNVNAEFFKTAEGIWSIRGDNRWLDRQNNTRLSCLHVEKNPTEAPNDMACNIMDHGNDEISVMFSQSQVLQVRNYLLSDQNASLELKSPLDMSYSESRPSSIIKPDGSFQELTVADLQHTQSLQQSHTLSSVAITEHHHEKHHDHKDIIQWVIPIVVIAVLLSYFIVTTVLFYLKYQEEQGKKAQCMTSSAKHMREEHGHKK